MTITDPEVAVFAVCMGRMDQIAEKYDALYSGARDPIDELRYHRVAAWTSQISSLMEIALRDLRPDLFEEGQ